MTSKFLVVVFVQLTLLWTQSFAQSNPCAVNTFQKRYGRTDITNLSMDIAETADHGYISVGWGANNIGIPFLMKVDKAGTLVWLRQIGATGILTGFIKKIIRVSDGNFIVLGRKYLVNYIDTWVGKFDPNGNTIWINEITYPTGVGNDGYNICETADHGLAIAASYAPYANAGGSLIMKLDANGNYLWGKGDLNVNGIASIIEKNGILYAAGDNYPNSSGVILKVRSSDGFVLGANTIRIDNMYTRFNGIAEMNGKIYIDASNTDNQSFDGLKQIIVITDTNLSVLKVHKFNLGLSRSWEIQSMFPTADGGFIASTCSDYGEADVLLFKVSYNGAIEWKRQYPRVGQQRVYNTKHTTDNGIVGTGFTNSTGGYYDHNDIFIFKTDSLGLTPDCTVQDPYAVITNPVYTNYATGTSYSSLTFPIVSIVCPNVLATIPTNTFCEKIIVPTCSTISITGKDTVCNFSDTVVYRGIRNTGCNAALTWTIDTSFAKIIATTDTTLKVKFKKAGTTKIYSSISDPCQSISDSITVHIFNSPTTVNLGADMALCQNSSYTLHAGPGFKTYRWQDGSSDSIFVVNTPGQYYVTAINFCNAVFSDTINISSAPAEFLDIGGDTSKCNSDTITLTATPGFASYSWSPVYNISSSSGQTVKVFPNVDTTYRVIAIKNSGCTAMDSIRIRVYHSSAIRLGNDTSICNRQSIVLHAGTAFISYLWNTGQQGEQITITAAGQYTVAATDIHECISRDTFNLISVFPNPVVALQKDSVLCQGSKLLLNAGAGYITYLWQDNSRGQTFAANVVGKYWVTVTDNNHCTGSDTMAIKTIAPVPANFVIKDTSICEGTPTVLSALGSFSQYLWSTGSPAKQITITATGTYWLQVTNTQGCIAREYTAVTPKNGCIQAVYFPNAFTPNSDGVNDNFRATVFGVLKNFHLAIYNRYGQKVFETNDFTKAWDAKVNSANTDSELFVWFSEYQFINDESKSAKGIVIVIR